MRSISADFALTQQGLESKVQLIFDESGTITQLTNYTAGPDGLPISAPGGNQHFRGILTTGFVNAHCHLELSYLKGALPRHTGMAGFIQRLQSIRNNYSDEDRRAAVAQSIADLTATGTIAIGDICNGIQSLAAKRARPDLTYYNFCEVFSLDPGAAEDALEKGLDLARQFGQNSSVTLHAPYSMSPRFRDLVYQQVTAQEVPLSIHFLESTQERQLFESLDGPLMELFQSWGLAFSPHTYDTVADFVLETLPKSVATLLVHCTELGKDEMQRITTGWPLARFVLCPLANEFIHNTQPPARMLMEASDRVCIGTDSLAGNDRLDMLAEIQYLQQEQGIPTGHLLRWASQNGAQALGLPMEEFTIREGANPRLIGITNPQGNQARIEGNVNIQLFS